MAANWSLDQVDNQSGRVAIVTGANTGLGFETAKALVGKGATVVMACRDLQKAETAKQRILSGQPDAHIEVRKIDTGSLASVREFAAAFQAGYPRLDLLINNAGIMITPHFVTEDGFEGQLGVNYLGHFLLTGLLLPLLNSTPGARIVSLYSIAAAWADVQFDDLMFESQYNANHAYSQSKLACLMFALELNRRLQAAGHSTRSLAAHPGCSESDLSRHLALPVRFCLKVLGPWLLQSAANGALPTLYAALAQDLAGGEAIGPSSKRQIKGPPVVVKPNSDSALDPVKRDQLWALSEQLCHFAYPL